MAKLTGEGLCAVIDAATSILERRGADDAGAMAEALRGEFGIELDSGAADTIYTKAVENHVKRRTDAEKRLKVERDGLAKQIGELEQQTFREWLNGGGRTMMLVGLRAMQASLHGNTASFLAETAASVPANLWDYSMSRVFKRDRAFSTAGLETYKKAFLTREGWSRSLDESLGALIGDESVQSMRADGVNLLNPAEVAAWHKRNPGKLAEGIAVGPSGRESAYQTGYGRMNYEAGPPIMRKLFRATNLAFNKTQDLLSAADRPARHIAFQNYLLEHSYLKALRDGLEGEAAMERARQYLGNRDPDVLFEAAIKGLDDAFEPVGAELDEVLAAQVQARKDAAKSEATDTMEILRSARADEDEFVFANQNLIGRLVATGKNSDYGPIIDIMTYLAAPFMRIGTNVPARFLEYTPVGAIGSIYNTVKAQVARKEAGGDNLVSRQSDRIAAKQMGRFFTGSGLMMAGYALAEILDDNIGDQGGTYEDYLEEQVTGRTKNGLRLPNGRWIKFQDAPQFWPLFIGVGLRRAVERGERTGEDADIAAEAFDETANAAKELPVLQMFEDIGRAIESGDNWALGAVRNIAGRGPNVFSEMDPDPYRRVDRPDPGAGFVDSMAQSVARPIMRDIPMLRRRLPVRYDAMGRPVERPTMPESQIRGLTPDMTDRRESPATQIFEALGYTPKPAPRDLPATVQDYGITDETEAQYQERVRLVGDARRRLIEDEADAMMEMTPNEALDYLQTLMREGHRIGNDEYIDFRLGNE